MGALGKLVISLVLSCIPFVPSFSQVKFIEHDITDLNFIEQISYFRSGSGHDYSYPYDESNPEENNRSMKHYFAPYAEFKGQNTVVPVYAPCSGTITRVSTEGHILLNGEHRGKQVWFTPDGYGYDDPDTYEVYLFHLNLDEKFPQGYDSFPGDIEDTEYITRQISAGELLGYADIRPDGGSFDVAVKHVISPEEFHLVSYFEVMGDGVFAAYQARGIGSVSDLILSKEYRDAHPVDWWGQYRAEDWVQLNAPNVVPEPVSMVLFVAGGAALVTARLRRKK